MAYFLCGWPGLCCELLPAPMLNMPGAAGGAAAPNAGAGAPKVGAGAPKLGLAGAAAPNGVALGAPKGDAAAAAGC